MSSRLSELPRSERRKVINERVVKRIREVTPPGMKDWDPIIDIIREPTDAFVEATDEWLGADTPETREELQAAADGLVRAWRAAGRRFEAEGRPETRTEVPA